jgi:hypothetical protein
MAVHEERTRIKFERFSHVRNGFSRPIDCVKIKHIMRFGFRTARAQHDSTLRVYFCVSPPPFKSGLRQVKHE